tara:strand:- start:90 stop:266 length:177 start_codon:yes stop_codon:yes gene_type:complete
VENSGILKTLLFTQITKNGIGKIIFDSLFDAAKLEGCYKVSLQCQAYNIYFYENVIMN